MNDWKYYTPKFECDELNYDLLTFAPWSGHRNFVYDFVGAFEPDSIVELGSHYGCSAFTFAQAVKDFELNTKMYFVDTWQGDDFTKKYGNDVYTIFSKTVDKFYSNQNINMMRMTFNEAVEKFEDKSIDVLHIDGSHHYDDVKGDFENWFPKVKDDGIIMLHDVSSDIVLGDVMGSYRYWKELKEKFKYTFKFDFSWGLGLIFLSKNKYEAFKKSVNGNKYQRINNALDVDYKDRLRKNYFEIKDRQMYIDDLLEQKKILNSHLEAYKENVQAKDKYAEELKQQNKATVEEINNNWKKEKATLIDAYEKEKKDVEAVYDEQMSKVEKDFNDTICGKDSYIAELEQGINWYKEQLDELNNRINQLTDLNNEIVEQVKKKVKRQVIKEETSKKVRDALESVVTDGGGRNAYINGYRIGGKTGTAQKAVNGSYVGSGYILSFVGVVPIDDPQIVLYVAMDNPKNCIQYGGTTVAPIARKMFVDILPALNVKKVKSQRQKSYSIMDKRTIKVENYIGKKRSEVQNISLRFTFVGKGNKVIDQLPRKGEYVEEGDTIVIMLGE